MKKSSNIGFLLSLFLISFIHNCITVPEEEINPEDFEDEYTAEEESKINFNPFKPKSKP